MKVVLVTENASANMSGEAALALYYFDLLRKRQVEVWLVCHERARSELRERYLDDEIFSKIHFVEDTKLQASIFAVGKFFPFIIRDRVINQIIHFYTQSRVRPLVKKLISAFEIELIFEPAPISPKKPSFMYGMGIPTVIGPMCGGMEFPPAFQDLESPLERYVNLIGRYLADGLNQLCPGKLQAHALLVANERTAEALPKGCNGKIYHIVESGVDLQAFHPRKPPELLPGKPTRFVYMARFVDQKGVPYLVEAFQQVATQVNAILELIGNGELYDSIQQQIRDLNIEDHVNLRGWMALEKAMVMIKDCDVYIVPAIRDCGGCAMLEAMAVGMPIIAANWAGPGEYADPSCAIVVDLNSKQEFIDGLAAAMIRLTQVPELRLQMGQASIARVRTHYFDWDSKVDRIVEIFQELICDHKNANHPLPAIALQES
jgi:glycosyltransferase involved in cell wall biosynthesis